MLRVSSPDSVLSCAQPSKSLKRPRRAGELRPPMQLRSQTNKRAKIIERSGDVLSPLFCSISMCGSVWIHADGLRVLQPPSALYNQNQEHQDNEEPKSPSTTSPSPDSAHLSFPPFLLSALILCSFPLLWLLDNAPPQKERCIRECSCEWLCCERL